MLKFLFLLLIPGFCLAEKDLEKKYHKEIAAVERYLNSYYTYSAIFKQSDLAGEISYGKLYIAKPENIRCEYNSPNSALLIINGAKITYYDKELDELSHASADTNALKILSLEHISLNKLNLLEVNKDNGFVSLKFLDYSKELKQNVYITMRFTYPKVNLTELIVLTEDSQINMILEKSDYNKPLAKELFYFNRIKNKKFD